VLKLAIREQVGKAYTPEEKTALLAAARFSGTETLELPGALRARFAQFQRLRCLQPFPGGEVRGGGLHVDEVPACDVQQLVKVLVCPEIPYDVQAFYDAGIHPLVGHAKDACQFQVIRSRTAATSAM
jgi:hypothetical protein